MLSHWAKEQLMASGALPGWNNSGNSQAMDIKAIGSEFKAFILKGNVVDLAVGVVIGAAFGKVVEAVVGSIINPLLALLRIVPGSPALSSKPSSMRSSPSSRLPPSSSSSWSSR
jgi:hypothetical protein